MTFPKAYADVVQRLRVPSGFLLLVAFVWWAQPSLRSLLWGLPLSICGLLIRGWAAGHLAKNQELATSGPYGWVRNPLYLGTLLVAAGLALASMNVQLGALLGLVFVFVYIPVMQLEEQHLRKLFPTFERYAEQVPMLLPSGKQIDAPRTFSFSLYLRNQEYKALLGFLVAIGLLFWKATV